MEYLVQLATDPAAWIALATLAVMEVVLARQLVTFFL